MIMAKLRRPRLVWLVATALLATPLAACGSPPIPGPQGTVAAYVAAWSARQWSTMVALSQPPVADLASTEAAVLSGLDVTSASYRAGAIQENKQHDSATATIAEQLTVADVGTLHLSPTLPLIRVKRTWYVQWSPATVVPGLVAGGKVKVVTGAWPTRAPIEGAGGVSLTGPQTMVTVGLVGARLKDIPTVTADLETDGATATQVATALAAAQAHPSDFEPVMVVTEARYQQIKPLLYPLPGTQFETSNQRAPLTEDLGDNLVGQVGPITAQQLATLGAPYTAGSMVGQNGLERQDEARLAGRPSITAELLGPRGQVTATLLQKPGVAPQPVVTTISPSVQEAAEAALDASSKPADLVAIDAPTGDVLAAVSQPVTSGLDGALTAEYPPGSTFKVITATDLLEHGDTPTSTVTCPAQIVVDGKPFHNVAGEKVSTGLPLQQAFAESCNTAFIGAAGPLPPASFPATAAQFGMTGPFSLGLANFAASVPAPASAVDQAADAIGQGQVVASPLALAVVAAAVDRGQATPPRLVTEPAPSTGSGSDAEPAPLDPTVVAGLRSMMAQVVVSGTAAGAGLPAGTRGKTGTAEDGPGNPPPDDAWFMGYDGNVAFAVVVPGGGLGASAAVPLVAAFLKALGPAA
jgi:cell division protein FtsI/penicillin-binding protein 2